MPNDEQKSLVLPMIEDKARKLAALNPGDPKAESLVSELLGIGTAILGDKTVQAIIPEAWKPYLAALVMVLGIVNGFLAGRATAPAPAVVVPAQVVPVVPTVPAIKGTNEVGPSCVEPKEKKKSAPAPVVKEAP